MNGAYISRMLRLKRSMSCQYQKRTFAKRAPTQKSSGWEAMKWGLGLAIVTPYIGYVLYDRIGFHNQLREEIEMERAESAFIKAELEKRNEE